MLKDREGGETGILAKATYNKEKGRLLPDELPEPDGGFTDEEPDF